MILIVNQTSFIAYQPLCVKSKSQTEAYLSENEGQGEFALFPIKRDASVRNLVANLWIKDVADEKHKLAV